MHEYTHSSSRNFFNNSGSNYMNIEMLDPASRKRTEIMFPTVPPLIGTLDDGGQ